MINQKVVIVDYKIGNLHSVQNACNHVGIDSIISSSKDDILNANAVILPGVGAFPEAMNNLKQLDLIEPLKIFLNTKKPLIGICLGMQLFFQKSEENGEEKGLGFLKGSIKQFPQSNNFKVP